MTNLKYDNLIKALFEVGKKELSGDICTKRGLSSCTVDPNSICYTACHVHYYSDSVLSL